jgi:translocation and assembly module TamA
MRTLPRNGSPKHDAGPQVSDKAAAGCEPLWKTPWHILAAVLLLATASSYMAAPAYAADPQPYKVELVSTGNSDINATLKATSDLVGLRSSAPVGPFGLIGRARSDLDRLKTVLESYGYYQSYVAITIDGLALDDPTLGEELTAKGAKDDARVKVTFTLGNLYHLRKVEIDGELPGSVKGTLALKSGDPAVASQVLAGGDRLQTALEDEGYAFAKVDTPIAHEDPANRVLDVSFHVVTGAKVNIGEIRIQGLKRMHESVVRKRLLLHTGEQYGASKVEKARKDLLALGVFTSVTVQIGTKVDSTGAVPITFRTRERPLHAVSLSGAYSTDLGGSSTVSWTHRDLTGEADQLTLSASVLNLGGDASTGVGYDLTAKYLLPEFGHRDQSLQLAVQAINQSLAAYDQKAITFGATLTRKFSSVWSASVGLTAEVESIDQEGFFQEPCSSATTCPPVYSTPVTEAEKNSLASGALIDPPYLPIGNVSCTPTAAGLKACTGTPTCTAAGICTEELFTTNLLASHYELLALPFSIIYNTTGLDSPLEDATHGTKATFSETPTLSFGTKNARFFVTQASISYYFDLHRFGLGTDPGRSVIALRALAGLAQGASEFSLPPDQRFYAGGSGTLRGYRYQSVGPLFPDGNPIGGTAINAGQAEYRQRIGQNLGFAVFLDAGQVSQDVNPLDSTLRFGAGAGVRYYTAIGPIRLDLGVPINRVGATEPQVPGGIARNAGDHFEIYIGLGQSF